jgi:hypothetical protein
MKLRTKVMVSLDYYLTGYKGTGPNGGTPMAIADHENGIHQ